MLRDRWQHDQRFGDRHFSQYGISVASANNTIAGNIVGLTQAGTAKAANSFGIYIDNVGGNTIGGTTAAARNIISGNTNDGVYITGASATNNLIQGNYIGTDSSGTTALSNGTMGIRITGSAAGNTIGGATTGAGNLISGNANSGIYIDASNTTVKGNLVGTNASGTAAIRNGSLGSATGGIFIASEQVVSSVAQLPQIATLFQGTVALAFGLKEQPVRIPFKATTLASTLVAIPR